MSARTILAAMVLYFLFVGVTANSEPDEPAAVDEKQFPRLVAVPVICLPASAFPELPDKVARYLDENGLYVPQVAISQQTQRVNVISGKFLGTVETDWAVLAVEGEECFVLIFPAGRNEDVQRHWKARVDTFLQGDVGDTFIFSRIIGTVGPEGIQRYSKFREEPVPFEVTHDGVDDYFLYKASTVWYFQDEKWVHFPGAD